MGLLVAHVALVRASSFRPGESDSIIGDGRVGAQGANDVGGPAV